MRSEPRTPRSGMNGTPFSVACSAVCTAGQVASRTTISPFSAASLEARREAGLAERHRARLDFGDAARADQQVGAHAEHRHAQQAQIPGFFSDQRSAPLPSPASSSPAAARAARRPGSCGEGVCRGSLSLCKPVPPQPSGRLRSSASAGRRRPARSGLPCRRCRCRSRARGRCRSW